MTITPERLAEIRADAFSERGDFHGYIDKEEVLALLDELEAQRHVIRSFSEGKPGTVAGMLGELERLKKIEALAIAVAEAPDVHGDLGALAELRRAVEALR